MLVGRWSFGSANVCDSTFGSTPVWQMLRDSAARVGRELEPSPPTFAKLHHLRRATEGDLVADLAEVYPGVAVPLAHQVGLVHPDLAGPWHRPNPANTAYSDGSVVKPLSGVKVDKDGVVKGSRSKPLPGSKPGEPPVPSNPRLAHRFEGKDGPREETGLPIAIVGCHGRSRWQRMILAFDLFTDGNEIGSALDLMDMVIDAAGGGVTHVVYDRLMSGTHMRRTMKRGVLPVVAVPEADARYPHLILPVEFQRDGYRSEGVKEKRKGKGARRRSGDGVAPKSRAPIHLLGIVTHPIGTRTCTHELWSLDGTVVSVEPGASVSLDSQLVECTHIRWDRHADGLHPIGVHLIPCRHGNLRHDIDFAGDRKGKNKAGDPLSVADWARPIPESANHFSATAGLRSDVESAFSWLKNMLPRNRAGSLHPSHFALDLLGAGLLCNAIAWDVHAAHHTLCAQHEAHLAQRRRLRG